MERRNLQGDLDQTRLLGEHFLSREKDEKLQRASRFGREDRWSDPKQAHGQGSLVRRFVTIKGGIRSDTFPRNGGLVRRYFAREERAPNAQSYHAKEGTENVPSPVIDFSRPSFKLRYPPDDRSGVESKQGDTRKPTARQFTNILLGVIQSILSDRNLGDLHLEAQKLQREYKAAAEGRLKKWTPLTYNHRFKEAYEQNGCDGLRSQIKYYLQGVRAHRDLSKESEKDQLELANLAYPPEWYPAARAMQRTIHLHVGPTNSGKTYHALKRLEQAESGIYAGPLRLLAYEVFTRLKAKGMKCDLITGDEMQIDAEQAPMASCTVEMVPTNREVEVAVIDEIQMIGNRHRGFAWTSALLGLRAKELHLCGEERTVPLLRELAVSMGDQLEVHQYKRLSPLRAMSQSLGGDLTKLQKGDAVIAFTKRDLMTLKNQIEKLTKKNVAIVYGSLPPESRAQQARLFNDPNNDYDYLVATDAIGMGLNLSIKRIIFDSTYRWNGETTERIAIHDLKQIAGRAGRYRVAPQDTNLPQDGQRVSEPLELDDTAEQVQQNKEPADSGEADADPGTTGFVTSLEKLDLRHVQLAMKEEASPIMAAGILPPSSVIITFAAYFPPDTPFSYILTRLHELISTKSRYFLCDQRDGIKIAQVLDPIQGLTIADRIVFSVAPAETKTFETSSVLQALAQCVAESKPGHLLDIPEIRIDLLDMDDSVTNSDMLARFENLHKALILYCWLSYRFAGVFVSRAMAMHVKEMVEARINKLLNDSSLAEKLRRLKQKRLARLEEKQQEGDQMTEATATIGEADHASQDEQTEERDQEVNAMEKSWPADKPRETTEQRPSDVHAAAESSTEPTLGPQVTMNEKSIEPFASPH